MKRINEYLSTKINTNKINDLSGFPEFPDYPDKDNIIKFLESKKFKKIRNTGYVWSEMAQAAKNSDCPIYILGEFNSYNSYSHMIVFSNNGEITKKNPMYLVRTNSEDLAKNIENCFIEYNGDYKNIIHFSNYKSFRKNVIKNFKW